VKNWCLRQLRTFGDWLFVICDKWQGKICLRCAHVEHLHWQSDDRCQCNRCPGYKKIEL